MDTPTISAKKSWHRWREPTPTRVPTLPPTTTKTASADRRRCKDAVSHVPKLTKAGYTVFPSLDKMRAMSKTGLANIERFYVKHKYHNCVSWEGAVDVHSNNLDAVVCIQERKVVVYKRDTTQDIVVREKEKEKEKESALLF